MQIPLDKVTQERLDALAARRRVLVRRRGLSASLLALIVALIAGAAIDRYLILSDQARWGLSIGVYLVVALAAWFYWIRPAFQAPSLRQLAVFVEGLRPDLREDLLSAVELGSADSGAELDSSEFRAMLQVSVAGRMSTLNPRVLLPPRLVRGWVLFATVSLVVFVGLLTNKDIRFGRLVARTLLPMADIERVSSTRLSILEPSPADALVPQGDSVPIRVACSGPAPAEVTLEMARGGRRAEFVSMPSADWLLQYQVTLQTDENAISYRVRAGDAITQWHTIQSRLRPYVTAFDVTYEYPAYMARGPRSENAQRRGDLTAHAGSTARVVLHIDQPVSQAAIEMEQGGQFTRVPVERVEPQKLAAAIPIQAAGEYKVTLLAAGTGFDSGKFSPRYEIKPLPDERPTVRLTEPAKDLLVPPNEIVRLAGVASDDVGLARVWQLVMVTEGTWQESPFPVATSLPSGPAATMSLQKDWDLTPLGLKPGDRLTTRLAVADLKGSVAESLPIRIMIASPGFSPADLQPIAARRGVFELLAQFEKFAAEAKITAEDVAGRLNPDDVASLGASVDKLRAVAGRLGQEASSLREALADAARASGGGADGWELAATGMVVARIQRDSAQGAVERVESSLSLGDTGKTREAFRQAAEMIGRVEQDAREVREIFSELLVSDEVGLAMQDLIELQRDQERTDAILRLPDAPVGRWTRREQTVLKQIKQVEMRFADLASRYAGRPAEISRRLAIRLRTTREGLAKRLVESQEAKTKPESGGVLRQLAEARTDWGGYIADEAGQADGQRRRLESKLPVMEPLLNELTERTREAAEQSRNITRRQAQGDKPGDMPDDIKRLKELEAVRDRLWRTVLELYSDRAKLEEARPDHDPAFVSDLDLVHRALKAIRTRPIEDDLAHKSLAAVNGAFKTLDAGHGVAELAAALDEVRNHERWESSSPTAHTKQPENSDFANHVFGVADRLESAGIRGWPRERLYRNRDSASWRESREQMHQRRRTAEPVVRVTDKLDRVAREAAETKDSIQERLAQARQVIAAHAPSLGEMMAGLADQAERVRQVALDTAAGLESKSPQEASRELAGLQASQTKVSEGVRDLENALRRDANLQDASKAEGRERARDDDDAVAMLEQPRDEADRAFEQVAEPAEREQQVSNLASAADREGNLANVLRQLGEHQQALESGGDVAASRAALRRAERGLGLQESLDSQFAATERVAVLAQMEPGDQMAAMARELGRSDEMRRALAAVARESLEEARAELVEASDKEGQVAERLAPPVGEENNRRNALSERLAQIGRRSQEVAAKDLKAVRRHAEQGRVGSKERLDKAEQGVAAASEKAAAVSSESIEDLAGRAKATATELAGAAEGVKAFAEIGRRAAKEAQRAGKGDQAQAEGARQSAEGASVVAESLRGMAQDARQIAQEAAQRVASPGDLHASQDPVGRDLNAASAAMERAARLEERVGDATAHEVLDSLAEGVEGITRKELPAATSALRTKGAGQAARSVHEARRAIDSHLAQLDAMAERGKQAAQSTGSASATALPQSAAESLARAMAQLDQSLAAPPNSRGQTAEQTRRAASDAAALARNAATATARAMRQMRISGQTTVGRPPRSEGDTPDSRSGADLNAVAGGESGALPAAVRSASGETWGKLPPKLAQDLMAGRREKVADDYRDMVETYFQTIAEKAKDNAQ
ncbi:MAG: hypothetical protein KA354_05560 [Phycisphaerae bacterium]|nr:hypothetical protein [Phycisphaerae bacterium]